MITSVIGGFPAIKCELREIDAFGLDSVVSVILKSRREHPKSQLSIDITGGTNIMAAGALLS